MYTEVAGRFKAIEFVAFKRIQDHLSFHRLQCHINFGVRGWSEDQSPEVIRQAMGFNLPFRAKHKGMLDTVFQFPDISWIIVRQEKCKHLLGILGDVLKLLNNSISVC